MAIDEIIKKLENDAAVAMAAMAAMMAEEDAKFLEAVAKMAEQPAGPVYTVGNEQMYDEGLIEHGQEFMKVGRSADYPGGYALRSVEDAVRLINEQYRTGEWAVYELAADWAKDTIPTENGWWHALVNTSVILGKVPCEICHTCKRLCAPSQMMARQPSCRDCY